MKHPFRRIGNSVFGALASEQVSEDVRKIPMPKDYNVELGPGSSEPGEGFISVQPRPTMEQDLINQGMMRVAPIYVHTEEKTRGIPANAFNIGSTMDIGHCLLTEEERLAGRQALMESLNGLTQEDINARMAKIAPIMPAIGNFGDSWREQLAKMPGVTPVVMIDSLVEFSKERKAEKVADKKAKKQSKAAEAKNTRWYHRHR